MNRHPRMLPQHSNPTTVDSSIRFVPADASQVDQDHNHGGCDVEDVDFELMQCWASTSLQPVHALPHSSPASVGVQYGSAHQDPWVSSPQHVSNGLTHFHEPHTAAFVEPIFSDHWVGDAASCTQSGNNNNLFFHHLPPGHETAATSNLLTDRALYESAAVNEISPSSSYAETLDDKSKYCKVRGARNRYHCTFRNPETMEKCPRIFQSRQGVVNHFDSEHLKIKIRCSTCNGRYPKSTLPKHQKRHDEENGLVNQRRKVAMEEMKLASNAQYSASIPEGANFNAM